MSNIIDKIQLSGVTYDIGGQGGSGVSVVEVTQAEYDALPSSAKTDTSKMYVITDAEAGDLTNYYTKTETDTLLSGKADTATTYTKDEVDNAITAATSTKQDTLVSGTNIKTINNESLLGSGNIDIQGGGSSYTAGDGIDITNNVISVTGKADTSAVTAVSNDLAIHTSNGVIHVTSADKSAWNAKSDFSGSYNDLTDKPTIPTVPTSNTAFTNDAGYITSGEAQTQIVNSISGKVDTTTYNTYTAATDAALATKQTTLTAGTNITIIDNVISATGGGGGGVTIDPTLDSGSTNPVANSAITEAVLVPSYMGLIEVQNDVAFPNATALYVEKTGSRDSCYIQASLSGESSVEDLIFIESFTAHTFEQEPSYVDYQWVDDALILTPKTSGNYFYKAKDVWGNLKISTIDNYSSGSSSSVIQNEIYPRIDEINNKLSTIKDIFTTEISFDPIYHDYGGYWRYDLIWKNNTGNTYTYYINKLRYNDFGYDNGVVTVKKTSGATSGSTDCITSGGVYEQMGGMKIVKLTQSAYDALSPNYDSNTLYVIVN